MFKLKGKVAVITGGSSGIGLGCARRFLEEGARVVIFSRDLPKLQRARDVLGDRLDIVPGDVARLGDLERLYTETLKRCGKIDVLVANAGVCIPGAVSQVTEDVFDAVVATNYKGVYFTVQKAIPHLNHGASIILTSSASAHTGAPFLSLYASTKSAVSQLARNLAADLLDRRIRVNAVSPGNFDTPLFEGLDEVTLDAIKTSIPAGRLGLVYEELTAAYLYLASDDSTYVNGSDIVIDGGVTRFSRS